MTDSADERPWKCEAQPLDAANPPHAGRRTALLYFMKHLHCRSYSLTLSLPLNRRYPCGCAVYSAACGVLASMPARESFRVADPILVRPAESRDRVFASINKEIQ